MKSVGMACRKFLMFLPLVLLVSCTRDPKLQAQHYVDQGYSFRQKGDLNRAMEAFRCASQLVPNDTTVLRQLALLLHATGKIDQAKPIYERILRIQPDDVVALTNLASIKETAY
jgi:Flp pilus assembly protein TadD